MDNILIGSNVLLGVVLIFLYLRYRDQKVMLKMLSIQNGTYLSYLEKILVPSSLVLPSSVEEAKEEEGHESTEEVH